MGADSGKRVYLFGAGASYGAREPRPPLGKDLHTYVLCYLGKAWTELAILDENDGDESVRPRLKASLEAASSFESLVMELRHHEDGRDLLKSLNQLMACALTPPINDDPRVDNAFVEKPDVYDQLLKRELLKRVDKTTFITLNYDCLFERAMCRVMSVPGPDEMQCLCKHINYCLADNSSGPEVLKPHGSINWVGDPVGVPVPDTGTSIYLDSHGVGTYGKINVVANPNGEHGEVIVAYYAVGKLPQANPSTLAKIRTIARERVRSADEVVIVGVHIPEDDADDPFLVELLREMSARVGKGCGVTYISPDDGDLTRAATWDFKPVQNTFEGFITSFH